MNEIESSQTPAGHPADGFVGLEPIALERRQQIEGLLNERLGLGRQIDDPTYVNTHPTFNKDVVALMGRALPGAQEEAVAVARRAILFGIFLTRQLVPTDNWSFELGPILEADNTALKEMVWDWTQRYLYPRKTLAELITNNRRLISPEGGHLDTTVSMAALVCRQVEADQLIRSQAA